jgi:hypothetical protein
MTLFQMMKLLAVFFFFSVLIAPVVAADLPAAIPPWPHGIPGSEARVSGDVRRANGMIEPCGNYDNSESW